MEPPSATFFACHTTIFHVICIQNGLIKRVKHWLTHRETFFRSLSLLFCLKNCFWFQFFRPLKLRQPARANIPRGRSPCSVHTHKDRRNKGNKKVVEISQTRYFEAPDRKTQVWFCFNSHESGNQAVVLHLWFKEIKNSYLTFRYFFPAVPLSISIRSFFGVLRRRAPFVTRERASLSSPHSISKILFSFAMRRWKCRTCIRAKISLHLKVVHF